MLIRNSSKITDNFYLLTLGASSFYLLTLDDGSSILFDGGCTAHFLNLEKRLASLGLKQDLPSVLFVGSLHPERISALRRFHSSQFLCPADIHAELVELIRSGTLASRDEAHTKEFKRLASETLLLEQDDGGVDSVDSLLARLKPVPTDNPVQLDVGRELRVFSHREIHAIHLSGVSAIIAPIEFGLYSNEGHSVPLAAERREAIQPLVEKLLDTEFRFLCLPYEGVLSGKLARDYLASLLQHGTDVAKEVALAYEAGVGRDEIQQSLQELFRGIRAPDPLLRRQVLSLEAEFLSSLGLTS